MICLFVSFEVKSKEVVLVCEVYEEKLLRDEKSGAETRVIEKSIFKNFNSKTELFYLDRKRKWLGEKKYSFKKKDLVINMEDNDYIDFITKDANFEYRYVFFEEKEPFLSSKLKSEKLETSKSLYDLSNILSLDLNTYDGTITYEKIYEKPQPRRKYRSRDMVTDGAEYYNVKLKKGVCKKSKGKLF